MSEETLDALSSTISCPICHNIGVKLTDGTLSRLDSEALDYRKLRQLSGKCPNCAEDGRGEVFFEILQRF
jgi:Zn finger protein HypA/HybF involved in hydrogenase expression